MKTPEILKLKVKPQRSMFGKLTGGHTASMLGQDITAATKEEAVEKLAERLDKTLEHSLERRYLITPKGTVFALYHYPGGWAYDIIRTGTPGASSPGSCMMGEDFSEAYESMKKQWQNFCDNGGD